MKRSILALSAALMLMAAGIGSYAVATTADAPECCQKKQSCCPKEACCSGGQHSQCPTVSHR